MSLWIKKLLLPFLLRPQPSEKTLDFLRSLARNYRIVSQLPQGLQGIILG